jgi:orotidine-5'-phosphate decarboxylase
LGAVVGATYPEEARELREIMKNNLFLIPGFGAQGGAASDAIAGFATKSLAGGASTVNVSRGLFSVFSQKLNNITEMQEALIVKAQLLNSELNKELES